MISKKVAPKILKLADEAGIYKYEKFMQICYTRYPSEFSELLDNIDLTDNDRAVLERVAMGQSLDTSQTIKDLIAKAQKDMMQILWSILVPSE